MAKLIAKQATIHLANTGAYAARWHPHGLPQGANRIVDLLQSLNAENRLFAIWRTNTVPASSYRGLGAAQITFPVESQMLDELAHKISRDPLAEQPGDDLAAASPFIPACVRLMRMCRAISASPPKRCGRMAPWRPSMAAPYVVQRAMPEHIPSLWPWCTFMPTGPYL